jgi:hypothetical protein
MNTTRSWLGAAALTALAACAAPTTNTPPGPRQEEVVRTAGTFDMELQLNRAGAIFVDTIPADPVRAWAHLPAVFDSLGLPVNRADVATRELAVVALQPRRIDGQRLSTFLDCGTGPTGSQYADSYQVYFWMSTRIVPYEGGSRVQTIVQANARPRDRSGEPLPCSSLARLERRVVELLRARLAGR